jgi:prepilin-type N-terminal cleavage/methylation domain-containing protein
VASPVQPGSRGWERRVGGFTLIELLVCVGIIALLLSIILPSLRSVRDQAKSLICMDHLRTTTFRFRLFADPYTAANRGNSSDMQSRFYAVDFLDSLYQTEEFWSNAGEARIDFEPGEEPVLCPAGPRKLSRYKGQAAHLGGIRPRQNISYAMNRRLHEGPTLSGYLEAVRVTERILERPRVPLMFDADGARSVQLRGGAYDTVFAAPPQPNERTEYSDGEYWHPSTRHRGRINIGFVGGFVVTTSDPLADASWDWGYHPPVEIPR